MWSSSNHRPSLLERVLSFLAMIFIGAFVFVEHIMQQRRISAYGKQLRERDAAKAEADRTAQATAFVFTGADQSCKK
jgi:hypothetical protein